MYFVHNCIRALLPFLATCKQIYIETVFILVSTFNAIFSHPQGKQKQAKRTQTFFQFCNAETGVLLCTDVAARGLDIPKVDWIVQFDPPDETKVRLLKPADYLVPSRIRY
jgi:ATP-dependent RNA helicase DDX18/HAS1